MSAMRIYLAGPMTGFAEHNVPAFDAARDALVARGFMVVSPADITRQNPQPGIDASGTIDPSAYRALLRLDITALLDVDAVAVLRGWERSPGARLELCIAERLGLPVYEAQALAANPRIDPLDDCLVSTSAWFDSEENDRCESCQNWRDKDRGATDSEGIWVCSKCYAEGVA